MRAFLLKKNSLNMLSANCAASFSVMYDIAQRIFWESFLNFDSSKTRYCLMERRKVRAFPFSLVKASGTRTLGEPECSSVILGLDSDGGGGSGSNGGGTWYRSYNSGVLSGNSSDSNLPTIW